MHSGPAPEPGQRDVVRQICLEVIAEVDRRKAGLMEARGYSPRPSAPCRTPEALYLLHIVFGLELSAISRFSGVEHSTVRYHVRRVEESREIARYDAIMDDMDQWLRACAARHGWPVSPLLPEAHAADPLLADAQAAPRARAGR